MFTISTVDLWCGVAPNKTSKRSEFARRIGLGRKAAEQKKGTLEFAERPACALADLPAG
jgi:hypothetical protein